MSENSVMPVAKKSKKKMRVITAVTGVAAAAAATLAPTGVAKASSKWTAWVYTAANVTNLQVCGYRYSPGAWHCTVVQNNGHHGTAHSNYMGTSWETGKVNVWEWNGTTEVGHTCNPTTGPWYARLHSGAAGLSLTNSAFGPLGMSNGAPC